MPTTTIPVNIAILPEPTVAQNALKISQRLSVEYDTFFTLTPTKFYPHITVYMTQLQVADLDRVKQILSDIANHTAPLMQTAQGYVQGHGGYIDADYVKTDEAGRLQMEVVEVINPLRVKDKTKAPKAEASEAARQSLEKYGYPSVGQTYRPHLTFTRFTDGKPIVINDFPSYEEFNGQFTRLGLFEMGDHGTCLRQIAEFPFTA